MGKGAGNICGKSSPAEVAQAPVPAAAIKTPAAETKLAPEVRAVFRVTMPCVVPDLAPPQTVATTTAVTATATDKVKMGKIYIVFYSMYGHVYQLAQQIKAGAFLATCDR